MTFSIITPTADRESHLKRLYSALLAQETKREWEWLICDTSVRPSPFFSGLGDARVRYFHKEEILTIGEKRNFLLSNVQGEMIVHCDDDDYYAPTYLHTVGMELEKADFFQFESWFCFDARHKELYYWATSKWDPAHFVLHPLNRETSLFCDFQKHQLEKVFEENVREGYGFTYSYRRVIAEKHSFPPIDYREDYAFFAQVKQGDYHIRTRSDEQGEMIHIIHDMNCSIAYPQYRVPPFLMKQLFPHFSTDEDFLSHC